MEDFNAKMAVVTGAGTGMGRELVRQLTAKGCHVAMCDINPDNMTETEQIALSETTHDVRLTSHVCDVSDEADVLAFRDQLLARHAVDSLDLVFNNAGIGGGGSFVTDEDRMAWEKTFDVCWYGVYNGSRAFLPLLVRSEQGHLVNTSSINGFWATVGPDVPHTAYCAAKFAVKGFTEALNVDLQLHAPHVTAHVVMPGHIGTEIGLNSTAAHGGPDLERIRKNLAERGADVDQLTDADLSNLVTLQGEKFRDEAPTTAAQASEIILDAVLENRWRILVGDDAVVIDELVREDPESAYETEFLQRIVERGHLEFFRIR
ncbi:MAG TPA: short-chain dehydrogenase [Acidimicrobiaceae bacterium]|nr:short-chain dehydrogenase [Acidimicrobiaceae bacterium]HAX04656.1 short-chain dehydrogenase [Acidimicrobiaceae bacterium]